MTVAELRKNGFRVRVEHLRRFVLSGPDVFQNVRGPLCYGTYRLSATGGETWVSIAIKSTDPLEPFSACGVARCSKLDAYNKKVGVAIALGRALKQMNGGEA